MATESDSGNQLSPQILMTSEYADHTHEYFIDPSQRPSQSEETNIPLILTLAQLNRSLIDQEEFVVLIINDTMSQDLQLSQNLNQPQLSQTLLGHEEDVYTISQPLSDLDEPLDMGWIFYPPDREECIKRPRSEEIEPKSNEVHQVTMSDSSVTSKQLDPRAMRPYLSPPRPTEQTQPSHKGQHKWGSYKAKTASSYTKEHQQHNKNKDANTTTDPQTATRLDIPSSSSNDITPKGATSADIPELQPSTSRAASSAYVIPKVPRKSLQSSKLNELVAKVSHPARPILHRPPSVPRKSPSKSVSGIRSTKRRR